MADEYEIRTVKDFLKVPKEKLPECLRDFSTWIEFANGLEGLFGDLVALEEVFIWVDDGKEGVSAVTITTGATE